VNTLTRTRDEAIEQADTLSSLTGGAQAEGASAADLAGTRHFTAERFCDWVESHLCDLAKDTGRPEKIVLTGWQRREMAHLLALDDRGMLLASVLGFNWPRRYWKSGGAAAYDLARALAYPKQNIVIQGNSEDQGSETAFAWIANYLRWSPAFAAEITSRTSAHGTYSPNLGRSLAGEGAVDWRLIDNCVWLGNESIIRVAPASERSTYGRRISVYHNTEACRALDENTYQAGASSTGDAWCGAAILDSNMGEEGNIVCRTQRAAQLAIETHGAQGDPAARVSYIAFDSIDEAVGSGMAPWLSERFLRSRAAAMPPSEFRRNHLNQPVGAGSPAFSPQLLAIAAGKCDAETEHRARCAEIRGLLGAVTPRLAYRQIRKMFRGGELRVGLGLDRSLGTQRGDATVLSAWGVGTAEWLVDKTLPVYDQAGELVDERPADPSVFVALGCWLIAGAHKRIILGAIDDICGLYGMPWAAALEQYQAADLADDLRGAGFDRVSCPALTDGRKCAMVTRAHQLLATERLIVAAPTFGLCERRYEEWKRYSELEADGRERSARMPRYGATKARVAIRPAPDAAAEHITIKDDTVEADLWAIEALGEVDPFDDGGLGHV